MYCRELSACSRPLLYFALPRLAKMSPHSGLRIFHLQMVVCGGLARHNQGAVCPPSVSGKAEEDGGCEDRVAQEQVVAAGAATLQDFGDDDEDVDGEEWLGEGEFV